MINIRQEMTGIYQEKFGDFPALSRENSETNVIIHQETVGTGQEMAGIAQEMVGNGRNGPGKIRRLRWEYCFHVPTFFRCFLAGTGPYFLTWEGVK